MSLGDKQKSIMPFPKGAAKGMQEENLHRLEISEVFTLFCHMPLVRK